MQFITLQFFIFFLAVFLLAILFKESKRYYKYFLLIVSLVFYLSFGLNFFAILVTNIFVNYLFLIFLKNANDSQVAQKRILITSIVVNVLFLAAFKYYNFGINTLLQTLNTLNIPANIQVLRVLIPVGISFYTFRNISHLIDFYRGDIYFPKFIEFANYIAFFPQIMSGPITRAGEFYEYLNNPSLLSYSQGRIITLVLSGLIKKYVIASYLYAFISAPFASPENFSRIDLILAAFAYSIMLYADFSGYSDFAIAISNLLGFDVASNFHNPYSSIGLKDFWNRWHISLSKWFRDYVYIQIGGSKKGKTSKYVNIMITMFLSGLWHGAGWNYIVWGILHGIGSVFSHFIADVIKAREELKKSLPEKIAQKDAQSNSENVKYEKSFKTALSHNSKRMIVDLKETSVSQNPQIHKKIEISDKYPDIAEKPFGSRLLILFAKVVAWAMTFIYITFAWIFFNSTSISSVFSFIGAIFTSAVIENKTYDIRAVVVILIVLGFNVFGNHATKNAYKFFDLMPLIIRVPVVAAIVYVILQLGPTTMPPFIYFNF